MRRPKLNRPITLIIVALLAVAGIILWSMASSHQPGYVLTINGHPVEQQEFMSVLNDKVAEAYSYFNKKYGAEDSKDFWNIPHDGTTPLQYVKELAVNELKSIKCKQMLMKDHGILDDISYAAFLKKWQEENKEREKALEKGKVIYGPKQYKEKEYYIYLLSNDEIDLKEKMANSDFHINDNNLSDYYEKNKETKYKLQDTLKLLVDGKELVFKHETQRMDSQEYPDIYRSAMELKAGQTDKVELESGQVVDVKCFERIPQGYQGFDEVKDSVRQNLIDEMYQSVLDQKIKDAKLEINTKVYKKIKVR